MGDISLIVIPLLLLFTFLYAQRKGIDAYSSFIKGVKDTLPMFLSIFPSLLAMILCVNLLMGCGIIDDIKNVLCLLFPSLSTYFDLVPMILFRPISGAASISCFNNICAKYGGDAFITKMASSIQGSTDTTIYVLSMYFGSVNVKKWKHALKAGLLTDAFGIGGGIILALLFLNN